MAQTNKKDTASSTKNKKKNTSEEALIEEKKALKDETRYGIYAVITFVLALFFIIASFHKAGVAGEAVYRGLRFLFGYGFALVPLLLIVLGVSFIRSGKPQFARLHTVTSISFLFSFLALLNISFNETTGGFFGKIVAWPFVSFFDVYVSTLFLSAIALISLFILFDTRPNILRWINFIKSKFSKKTLSGEEGADIGTVVDGGELIEETETEEVEVEEHIETTKITEQKEEEFTPKKAFTKLSAYIPPPISLLERDKGKANVGDIKANANIIKRTLLNFGIEVEMDEITIGPTFTRYALKPAVGVKLSRIVGLQNDLALSLAAHPVRIEAPIPGKSLVGIEIPNKTKATVGLGTLLSDERFQNAPKPLMTALGRDVAGKPHYVNLAKAPHALIAGTTGSGKSVTIHAVINSLIYRNGPQDLKFIMVDPKRVELTLYNKIPHLLTPVITDAKKAILALKWAAKEMEERYQILQDNAVRDIESYHDNVLKGKKDVEGMPTMPYIVIIIDELADIMQAFPRELEAGIVRLAQMSRAVGIHLILSTQRPEVNVITGLIKSNVPTRIALRVPTGIDSRTILDTVGAEKLLGQGDMLYSGGEGQPQRLQSAYISEDEVKKVVKYLTDAYQDELPDTIDLTGVVSTGNNIFESGMGGDGDDDLYEEAKRTVIETGKASTSFLQRKLSVGYARAARLIDLLEERGIVGPGNGAKPREVIGHGTANTPVEEE